MQGTWSKPGNSADVCAHTYWRLAQLAAFGLLAAMAGCASTTSDPLEAINRATFDFNQGVAEALAGGETGGGNSALDPVTETASNVITNLREPLTFANAIFQGRECAAGVTLRRFLTNSTLGVGGLFDIAKEFGGLDAYETDFGETLGIWGVPSGAYVVLPFLGPTDTRGIAGFAAEYFLDPTDFAMSRAGWDTVVWTRAGVEVTGLAVQNAEATSTLPQSLDPYVRQRADFIAAQYQKLKGYECPAALHGRFWSDGR